MVALQMLALQAYWKFFLLISNFMAKLNRYFINSPLQQRSVPTSLEMNTVSGSLNLLMAEAEFTAFSGRGARICGMGEAGRSPFGVTESVTVLSFSLKCSFCWTRI